MKYGWVSMSMPILLYSMVWCNNITVNKYLTPNVFILVFWWVWADPEKCNLTIIAQLLLFFIEIWKYFLSVHIGSMVTYKTLVTFDAFGWFRFSIVVEIRTKSNAFLVVILWAFRRFFQLCMDNKFKFFN